MKRMLLGVGNRLSHDDGAGPAIAQALLHSDWISLDCGTALENATGIVSRERPDVLVIVDAAVMGGAPGNFHRLPIQAEDCMLASAHGLPLSFVLSHIKSAAKETILIGIEPGDLSFGEGLSPAVAASARTLAELLRRNDLEGIPKHESLHRGRVWVHRTNPLSLTWKRDISGRTLNRCRALASLDEWTAQQPVGDTRRRR